MVYLRLFHGRKTRGEDMEDWGTDGPVLGPFEFVHMVGVDQLNLGPPGGNADCEELPCHDGLVYYAGVYYGDWSVIGEGQARMCEAFDARKAVRPKEVLPADAELYSVTITRPREGVVAVVREPGFMSDEDVENLLALRVEDYDLEPIDETMPDAVVKAVDIEDKAEGVPPLYVGIAGGIHTLVRARTGETTQQVRERARKGAV